MLMRATVLLALLASVLGAPACRCLPGSACWPSQAQWSAFNASVGGRLVALTDPLQPCYDAGLSSAACDLALNSSDDEFWLTSQPGGYLHTGLFGVWNLTTKYAAYAVAASDEGDVAATVAFAHAYNLRLAVKSTGHDWYDRSTAPDGLLLWTHGLSSIAFDDAHTTGCAALSWRLPTARRCWRHSTRSCARSLRAFPARSPGAFGTAAPGRRATPCPFKKCTPTARSPRRCSPPCPSTPSCAR